MCSSEVNGQDANEEDDIWKIGRSSKKSLEEMAKELGVKFHRKGGGEIDETKFQKFDQLPPALALFMNGW
jgi:hypothetical protein